jgi:TolA-binding protein
MKYYRVAQGVLAGISKCAPRTRDLPWAVRDEKGTLLEGTSLAARVRLLDAECFLRQGIALNHQKRPDAASVAIESALGIVSSPMESDSEEAVLAERLYIKASALMEKQTYQEARAVFEDLISTCAGHRLAPKARLQAIICLEKEGKREEAFPLYEGLIADKADSEEAAEALLRMGYYCYNQREYSECREYFSRFLRAFPRHERVAEVDFKRGLTLSLQESFMEAGEHFRSFGQRHPGSDQIPAALYWAGDAYLKAGDATRSSEMFKRTIAEYPETKWAKFAKGRLARLGEQSEWIQPVP